MSKDKIEQHVMPVDLDLVMRTWANEYTTTEGEIVNTEWYVDPIKNKAVFVLTIKKTDDEIPNTTQPDE